VTTSFQSEPLALAVWVDTDRMAPMTRGPRNNDRTERSGITRRTGVAGGGGMPDLEAVDQASSVSSAGYSGTGRTL
jgi:hypothetical protein